MTRRPRLQVERGCYYAQQNGAVARAVFQSAADFGSFETLLREVAADGGIALHAYCLLPDAIHLALTLQGATLASTMQRLAARYARLAQSRRNGHFFRHRYRALLLEPERHLLPLVRYVHHLPAIYGLVDIPAHYAHSSDSIYRGERKANWVARARIGALLLERNTAYDDYMRHPPKPEERAQFEDARASVLGSPEFRRSLKPRLPPPRAGNLALEQLVRDVAQLLEVTERELASRSRRHNLVLARALIAWLASERQLATLSDLARRFGRDLSTLTKAIARSRRQRPDLFRLDVLHHLAPLHRAPP